MKEEAQATPELIEYELVAQARRLRGLRPALAVGMEGLSTMETHALTMLIDSHKEGVSIKPSDIAHRFHVSPSAVSQFLKNLEEKGYITRTRSAGDSRSVRIALTERGEQLSEKIRRERTQGFAEMVEAVGLDEMVQFVATLEKICEYVESSDKFVPVLHGCGASGRGVGPCA